MEVKEEHKNETRQLIREGKSIEAVKYLQDELNLDLKTSMKLVQAIRDGMDPSSIKPAERLGARFSSRATIIVPGIFCLVGLIMLGITTYIFISQKAVIDDDNLVKARVVATPSNPLFEYEFKGQTYRYQSSTSSEPPSYKMGEEVDFYVDEENPSDGIVDTFTDRWLLIVIFGGIGGMFFGTSLLVMFIFRKRV